MINDYFRVTAAHDTVLDDADLFPSLFAMTLFRKFDTRWDEFLYLCQRYHPMKSWKVYTKYEYVSMKTVLELYDMEIHQKVSMPNYQKLKTMVKRSTYQKLQKRYFDARHEKIETEAVVKSHKGLSGVERGKGICYQWKEKGWCSKGNQCSFWHESNDRAKPTPKAAPPSEPESSKIRGGSVWRKRNARGRSQSEKFSRPPCKYFLNGICTKSPCECWQSSRMSIFFF